MSRMLKTLGSLAAFIVCGAVAGCSGRSLDTPERLRIDEYAAGQPFTVTFDMKGCSDTCATYEVSECAVEQLEGNVLQFSISVPYGDKDGADGTTLENCSLTCGPPVLAHCAVPALSAGVWTVEAGTFRGSIEVR